MQKHSQLIRYFNDYTDLFNLKKNKNKSNNREVAFSVVFLHTYIDCMYIFSDKIGE
jgi:hypothetical protein